MKMTKQKEKGNSFLPTCASEMHALGWQSVDIILVTGDAYIDHPAFGVALVARLLEHDGFRVAVLAQPRHDNADDFKQFGSPRLFFGITAGNLDSIVANYTGNGKVRDVDQYSADGNPYFSGEKTKNNRRRPDRAAVRFAGLARSAFKDVPVVLGGLEASLRRFVHYDYQQKKIRASALTDAKADILVYGMGERAIREIARRLDKGQGLQGIAGTCQRFTQAQYADLENENDDALVLPSFADINSNKAEFLQAELTIDKHARAVDQKNI